MRRVQIVGDDYALRRLFTDMIGRRFDADLCLPGQSAAVFSEAATSLMPVSSFPFISFGGRLPHENISRLD